MNFKIETGGLCLTLFIVFLVLKLCNIITWSWWWITAPLWVPAIICVGLFLVIVIIAFISSLLD